VEGTERVDRSALDADHEAGAVSLVQRLDQLIPIPPPNVTDSHVTKAAKVTLKSIPAEPMILTSRACWGLIPLQLVHRLVFAARNEPGRSFLRFSFGTRGSPIVGKFHPRGWAGHVCR